MVGDSDLDLACQSFAKESTVTLHLSYHTSVMLIHRPFLRPSEGMPDALRDLSQEAVTSSAASFTRIIRSPDISPRIPLLPFFVVHHVLTAGICHLFNATSTTDAKLRRTSGRNVKDCAEAIERLAETWPERAGQALKVLRELATRWKVVWALPMHLSNPIADNGEPTHQSHADGIDMLDEITYEEYQWL